jgi:hypothetical protein
MKVTFEQYHSNWYFVIEKDEEVLYSSEECSSFSVAVKCAQELLNDYQL